MTLMLCEWCANAKAKDFADESTVLQSEASSSYFCIAQ